MGLDGVEIVMGAEKAFGITIEDSEAWKIETPRQLIDLVLSKVERSNDQVCLSQRAFHRLRASLMRHLGIQRRQVRLETSLKSLFPRSTRKEDFRQISSEFGLGQNLEFVRPAWLTVSIMLTILLGGIVISILLIQHPILSQNSFLNFLFFPVPLIGGTLFATSLGWLAFRATRSMRIEFQPSLATIGDLSRWMMVNSSQVVKAQPGQWSREQVSEIIREIVIDVLGCEKDYREDALFVKDLGLC